MCCALQLVLAHKLVHSRSSPCSHKQIFSVMHTSDALKSHLIELLNRFIQPFLFLLSHCCLFFVVWRTCITLNVGFPDSLENECKELSDGIYNLDKQMHSTKKKTHCIVLFSFLRYTLRLEKLYLERIRTLYQYCLLVLFIHFIRTNLNLFQ